MMVAKKVRNISSSSESNKKSQQAVHVSNTSKDSSSAFSDVDAREYRLFRSLDLQNRDSILVSDLLQALSRAGLVRDDYRLSETMKGLDHFGLHEELSYQNF